MIIYQKLNNTYHNGILLHSREMHIAIYIQKALLDIPSNSSNIYIKDIGLKIGSELAEEVSRKRFYDVNDKFTLSLLIVFMWLNYAEYYKIVHAYTHTHDISIP